MEKSASREGERAVFFDRDGTINEDPGYLDDPARVALLPGAADAIGTLNRHGIKAVVVTNQSGVGRGFFTEETARAINERIEEKLNENGARLDGIYYCPHRPDQRCGCRKPAIGLVLLAAVEHGIDLERSYVVGDKGSDIELATNINAKGVLVLTGYGVEQRSTLSVPPDFVARDIRDAVNWIVEDLKSGS